MILNIATYSTFDEAMSKALEDHKYDVITGRSKNTIAEFFRAVYEWLENLFSKINIRLPDLPDRDFQLVTTIILVVIVLTMILLAAILIIKANKRKLKADTMEDMFSELKFKNMTFEELFQKANHFASEALYREAVRYFYLSLLFVLNKKKLISIDGAKTNNELKGDVKKNANLYYEGFCYVVEIFNRMWFGNKAMTKEKFDDFYARIRSFILEVQQL